MDLLDQLKASLGNAYIIERELGGGGMSRVFLAHEIALDRNVVVKVLDGQLTAERFAREIRFAASLQHSNIVPVLTTGVAGTAPYYTMPFVKGESLRVRMNRSRIPPRESLGILRDIARALQYAHGEGVVHRDIKPENILLSSDAALVADFGIAKAISAARTTPDGALGAHPEMTLTQAGSSVGTPAYMAPEQVAGEPVDHRSDLYAWGMIAYELLTGEHPFPGKTNAAQLMAAQISQFPRPIGERASGIAPAITRLVMDCLEKAPAKRPASAFEILQAFDGVSVQDKSVQPGRHSSRRLMSVAGALAAVFVAAGSYVYLSKAPRPAAPTGRNSVAVLPFADDRADSASAYFGEGIADELMNSLAKVPGLRVASRTSSIALGKRQDLDVREIARQLGVSAVVEGTVRRSGGQLRVTAQLTNAVDGLVLWSESYERAGKDVFAVQDDITSSIVTALLPELGSAANAPAGKSGTGTTDPEAYDLYLRGLYLLERRGRGVSRAAEYFSEAIEQDAAYARAHAGLASALAFYPYFAGVPAHRVEARVRAAAERSLQLDPSLSEPRVALALAHWHALRWSDAEKEFLRAIAADSASPAAHLQYGRMLLSRGDAAKALAQFRTARRLDPLGATAAVWLAAGLGYNGDHAGAWEESKRARELDPNLATARTFLSMERINAGFLDQARQVAGNATLPIPFNGQLSYVLHKSGDEGRAAAIRRQLEATPDSVWWIHTARVPAYLATLDTARALTEMERAVAKLEMLAQAVPFIDPMFDAVRKNARFAAIMRNTGIPPGVIDD